MALLFKVGNELLQAGVTSRPLPKLTLFADLRYEDRDDRTPLDTDDRPRVYRPEQAHALWSALVSMEPVFQRFRRVGWL